METTPPDDWLFEVYLTHRRNLGAQATLSRHSVRVANASSRRPAAALAHELLAGVLAQQAQRQSDLFTPASTISDWHLRFAQSGAVDEFTLGVQAVYLDPNSEVVSLLGMHFPEEPI